MLLIGVDGLIAGCALSAQAANPGLGVVCVEVKRWAAVSGLTC